MSQMKTVRLVFPQWQGGYDETSYPGQIYAFGAHLLAHLAPQSDAPTLEVPVPAWEPSMDTPKEGGVFFRSVIMRQIEAARHLLEAWQPERVITFGGDCLVSQAPITYLNERYSHQPGSQHKMGILWIDAHPDITTPADFDHSHAMVLGNLMGYGVLLAYVWVMFKLSIEDFLYIQS